MATATVELARECKYLVLVWRSVGELLPGEVLRFFGRRGPATPLPADFRAFSEPDLLLTATSMGMRLYKDTRGRVDVMPLLAAADWLRDRGWTVEGIGWCGKALADGVGAA